jgi:hypothetical protein
MPTERTRRSRRLVAGLTPYQRAHLLDRELPEADDEDRWWRVVEVRRSESCLAHHPRSAVALWRAYRDELLRDWLRDNPGRRPQVWWEADAPRQPLGTGPGCFSDGKLPLPRRRLGGVGTPLFECTNTVPAYFLGIPAAWITQREVELFSGRRRDVHGRILFPEWQNRPFAGVAIDPLDPPRFESEASYLERLGLLLPGERRRLREEDFVPEVLLPDDDEDDPGTAPPAPRAA